MITKISLLNFKKISSFESELASINILVGSNNSGKSSVLQGIHFSIMAEVKRRQLGRDTIPQDELLYVPASDFSILRHNEPYTNYSGATSKLVLYENENGVEESFSINISKGRNHGNISIQATQNNKFRQQVTSFKDLYSAYTPGLSGISVSEKLVSKAVLRHAAANGDANLYLRNIIYYINCDKKLGTMNDLVRKVFPGTSIKVIFDEINDIFLNVEVRTNGKSIPIELCGTGLLQVIQIMAYVVYFKPKLLLLDEPDEHLHPNNQLLLSNALKLVANEYSLQLIISTHSRHLITSLEYDAKIIWLTNGSVNSSESNNSLYDILLDLGALDSYDGIIQGKYNTVFLTEDTNIAYLKRLLIHNGYDLTKTQIIPYSSSSRVDAAILLANYLKKSAPNCRIIIHRDRDFMTKDEVDVITNKVKSEGILPWITDGPDIESYFTTTRHISLLTGKEEKIVDDWIKGLLQTNHVEIQHKFESKRNDIKTTMYKNNKLKQKSEIVWPSFESLFGTSCPTDRKNVIGKYLLSKINGDMMSFAGKQIDLLADSEALEVASLRRILTLE